MRGGEVRGDIMKEKVCEKNTENGKTKIDVEGERIKSEKITNCGKRKYESQEKRKSRCGKDMIETGQRKKNI